MSEFGKSIVIEGNDGTGKSTQVEMYAQYLMQQHGIGSLIIHEPDGPVEECAKLRARIKDATIPRTPEENLEWFTQSREISDAYANEFCLPNGKWVLRARNYLSTLAYQGAGEGLSEDLILRVTEQRLGQKYMHPDHTIILDLSDPEERAKRIAKRGELEVPDTFESKGDDFQRKVNTAYVRLAMQYGYPIVNANQSPEQIQAEIREIIGV